MTIFCGKLWEDQRRFSTTTARGRVCRWRQFCRTPLLISLASASERGTGRCGPLMGATLARGATLQRLLRLARQPQQNSIPNDTDSFCKAPISSTNNAAKLTLLQWPDAYLRSDAWPGETHRTQGRADRPRYACWYSVRQEGGRRCHPDPSTTAI